MNTAVQIAMKPRDIAVLGNYWSEGSSWYVKGPRAILHFHTEDTARQIANSILNPYFSEQN